MTPETPIDEHRESVHKQNLYIVSFPIIFLFNILRSILYQFFIVFKYIFNVSAQVIHRPVRKKDCNIEVIVNGSNLSLQNQQEGEFDTMTQPVQRGPGPGDPLLAKQKHHHRRAFEYISKALKIDEENEGMKVKVRAYFHFIDLMSEC